MRRFALDLALTATLLWLGFVVAISFFEAPLKFQAGVPQLHALAIGRVVFTALNRVEWLWATVCGVTLYARPPRAICWLFFAAVAVLAVQTWALLPTLDLRTRAILAGEHPPASNLHLIYVVLEFIKAALLLSLAWCHLRARPALPDLQPTAGASSAKA